MIVRLLAVVAALIAASAASATGNVGSLDRDLSAALDAPGVSSKTSTAMVVEIPSGDVVFARNTDLPLEPASNEKLCVNYASLVVLGPRYRFPTEALAEGVRVGSILRGNLVLKGFGDPSLTTSELERLVGILWREGIRKITGRVVGDASWFDDDPTAPGWLPSFAGLESPPISALVVDRAVSGDQLVSDPPLAAASDLDALLHAHGILAGRPATGTAAPGSSVLATIYSPPLPEILEFMDQNSDNFTAEMLLKAIGAAATGRGTTAAGALVVREVLARAGVPLGGVRIVDGSGLSRWDRVTAAELSALLLRIWNRPTLRAIILDALPVAGETGTLEYRMTTPPARGLVHAKTGTTDIASALSGFVGSRFAFVTIENGDPVNAYAARAEQDRVAETLAALIPAATG